MTFTIVVNRLSLQTSKSNKYVIQCGLGDGIVDLVHLNEN
jgi:hypothetical protein